MKKKVIILISCLSFMTLITGCSESEDKEEAVIKQELEEVEDTLKEKDDNLEEVQDSLKAEDDNLEEVEDSEDISTDPIEIVTPNSDDTPLIEINNYCKSIAHNLKNYYFEYIEDLFVTDMEIEVWEEELVKLGKFEQVLGVQTTMLTSFLLEDENTENDDDKETYEVIVRESYLKDGLEQELRVKIILTEKLFISQIEVQVK